MTVAPRTPATAPLRDGYQMVVTFASDADISIWEKTVTPPGYDNGEEVDTTTMHNDEVETRAPQGLNKPTNGAMTVAYDPAALADILALVGKEDDLTYHFPNLSSWTDRGYLKSFVPNEIVRGQQPTAACVIVSTSTDSSGDEAKAEYVAPPA